ncbi:FtsX-like permease family protein [Maribellus comscasis]|uniref:FtsX-like permease family protein n=1 Tax=Maribellus comscasis TaxID=2681766 RepID=A0A6I6JWU6_9BACT|nr:FtsX-like permease family protein [Maribellus comscasis]QGY44622.1 FtsX-like permease family protein [Maribellus comscasis]
MRFKAVLRSLFRYRLNSSIIIISLAIGIACMNLITIFITRENNADGFQKNKKNIYALQADDPFRKGEKMYFIRQGAAEYMKDNFAEVKDFCRIINTSPSKINANNQDYFENKKTIAVSSNFFTFFSYKLISGNPARVLETKQNVVISDKLAMKYFGRLNVIGQKLLFPDGDNDTEMFISGVFEKPQESTQLDFEMVKLIGESDSRVYLQLAENTNIVQLEEKFAQNKENIPIVHDGTPGTHSLKSLKAAYFDTSRGQTIETSRDRSDLLIALVIAVMILGVALFNYLGLINNQLMEKTREYSIRRVNGSSKINLINAFMGETFMLVGVAFALSLVLMILAIPFFNQLTSTSITSQYIFHSENIFLLLGIPAFILLASFLFAFFKIGVSVKTKALKPGKLYAVNKFQIPVFNIAQLAVSVILIIGSIVILKQINYITNKKIGLAKKTLEVKVPRQYKNISPVFKAELEKSSSVELVSLANASPVLEHMMILMHYDENGVDKQYTPALFWGDENYPKALGIEIIKGDNFSENAGTNKGKCIINESLAALFPDQDLIGKYLPGSKNDLVIGICKDFHYGSLKEVIEPGYVSYGSGGFFIMVKPSAGQSQEAREVVAKIWKELIPDFPLNMESINDRYEWMHRENTNYAKLIGACCIISVFLSMIGLFAVSFHTSRRRVKEIGIRKVNGATISEILALLNKDFVMWVGISFVLAIPAGWYFMHKWLESFMYKTNLSWWIFSLAGIIALAIALVTVSIQSWKAASKNPVEALRYE